MPFESLKKYDWNSSTVRPIVIIDWKVYARDVEGIIKNYLRYQELSERDMINYMKAIWAFKLNRGPDCLRLHENSIGFTGIIVDDTKGEMDEEKGDHGKGYWRNFASHELGLPPYKGGRQPKDDIMLLGMEVGLKYLEKAPDFFYFAEEYYEADDLAALACRLKRQGVAEDRAMYLSTLDGDWQVLVSDEHKITWCNTKHFNDRIRGNSEVIDYYIRTKGIIINHPKEVSILKVTIGDVGDNLFKGSPLRLFDLLDEDEEYKISAENQKRMEAAMETDIKSNNPEHLQKSINFMLSKGWKIPEVQNPSEDQYLYWENSRKYKKNLLDFSETIGDYSEYFSEKDLNNSGFTENLKSKLDI